MKKTRVYKTMMAATICWSLFCQPLYSDWTSFRDGGRSQVVGRLPVSWGPQQGIAWQRELPGYGQSTPVIFGDQVFVTAVEGTLKEKCTVVCYAFGSGEELWRKSFDSANQSPSNFMASRAAPTPVVDERGVYVFFETGDVAYFVNKGGVLYCLDAKGGQMHYTKRLGTDCWGTPIVAGDLVYFFGKDGKTQVIKATSEFELVASNQLWDEAQPPKPEHYVEHAGGGHGHGGSSGNASGETPKSKGPSARSNGGGLKGGPSGGPGGGMMAALMAGDKNGDGILQADEISADFKPMLARIDTNKDGSLDAAELKSMVESFAARRTDSQASARDPIVYGAAASDGKIVIRTGTRLYCIQ